MKWEFVVAYLLKFRFVEKIIENNAKVICRVTVFIFCVAKFFCLLIVFDDRWSSILKAHNTDFFVGVCFPYNFCTDSAFLVYSCTDKAWVSNTLENIINSKNIDPLDIFFVDYIDNSRILHR